MSRRQFFLSLLLLSAQLTTSTAASLPQDRLTPRQFEKCDDLDTTFPEAEMAAALEGALEGNDLALASYSVAAETGDERGWFAGWDQARPGHATVCRVRVTFTPSGSTNPIQFGLFLPSRSASDSDAGTAWNGRFLAVGNGLFDGGVNRAAMFQYMAHGYAAMSTDTGHAGAGADGARAMASPDRQADWAWRAMASAVPMAKRMVELYYGVTEVGAANPAPEDGGFHSYYAGCSTGGRMGLRQVGIDPSSFHGLLIGAPAWDTANILPWVTFIQTLDITDDQAAFIARTMAEIGGCEVGTRTPDACKAAFDRAGGWELVSCAVAPDEPGCLEDPERTRLFVADNVTVPGHPEFAHRGYDMTAVAHWKTYLANGNFDMPAVSSAVRASFFDSDPLPWDEDGGVDYYEKAAAWVAEVQPQVDPGAVAAYARAGGKVMLYTGLRDGFLPSGGTFDLFEAIGNTDNVKYYEIPGGEHCVNVFDQTVPWYVGGPGVVPFGSPQIPYVPLDAQSDGLEILADWAEGDPLRELKAYRVGAGRALLDETAVPNITERS